MDNFPDANNNSKNQLRLCMKEDTRHMRPIKKSGRNNRVSIDLQALPGSKLRQKDVAFLCEHECCVLEMAVNFI